MVRPRRLERGARIAVVAPASPFQRRDFDAGVDEIHRLGFVPVWEESVFARQPYVAGPPETRAAAIRSALLDPSVAALIAVRGGYGSAQILPLLDAAVVSSAAKAIIGYSDITALLAFVTTHCGLVAFHGPMLEGRLSRGTAAYDLSSFTRALCVAEPMGELEAPGVEALAAGDFTGPILGGTITQLLSLLGTPYAFNPPDGHVLFLDEVGERPYRLDRMVTQLRQSGVLAKAGAIVIGELPGCDEPGGEPTGRGTMAALFADFHGPVLIGFPSGHTVGPQQTIPFGVRARVVADRRAPRLIIEEPAVQ
jgi:muramoyltetrapeptide carboxypeptidase